MLPDLFQPHVGRHHLVLLILQTDILQWLKVVTSKYILQLLCFNKWMWNVAFFFFFFNRAEWRVHNLVITYLKTVDKARPWNLQSCVHVSKLLKLIFQLQNSFAKSKMFKYCYCKSISTREFFVVDPCMRTHHIDELCNGQSEFDDDHVSDVRHGSGVLVVPSKQLLEEDILSMRVHLLATENYRYTHFEY